MTDKEDLLIRQKIQEERGAYGRARRKKFLHLKRTGQLSQYYQQKAGIKTIRKTIRSFEGPGLKESLFRRLINSIKLCLKKLFAIFVIRK